MRHLLWLTLTACLLPAAASAQSPGPSYAPMELTADDLGTWDVELTGRGPHGRLITVRGVETNTVGCDGRCIVTKAGGDLKAAVSRSGSSGPAWWREYDRPAGADVAHAQTGLRETPVASSSEVGVDPVGPPTQPRASRTIQRTNGSLPARISVEYPDPDRRIVTTFGIGPDGQQMQLGRVVYTRRK